MNNLQVVSRKGPLRENGNEEALVENKTHTLAYKKFAKIEDTAGIVQKALWSEEAKPGYGIAAVKYGSSSIVMGMLISQGLTILSGLMEQRMVHNIEKFWMKNLLPSARKLKLGRTFVFQQDIVKKNNARTALQLKKNMSLNGPV